MLKYLFGRPGSVPIGRTALFRFFNRGFRPMRRRGLRVSRPVRTPNVGTVGRRPLSGRESAERLCRAAVPFTGGARDPRRFPARSSDDSDFALGGAGHFAVHSCGIGFFRRTSGRRRGGAGGTVVPRIISIDGEASLFSVSAFARAGRSMRHVGDSSALDGA